MTSLLETVLLGIIQGITEWLPISSSGHLAVAKEFIKSPPPVLFYVFLHLGTLFVILFFFRRAVFSILKAFAMKDFSSASGRLGIFIVVGSVPTALLGYTFQSLFKTFFDNLSVVAVAFAVTGFLLFFSRFRRGSRDLNFIDALIIGIAQGIAIIPGISRSGVTVSSGLLRGVDGRHAFEFSFLLSIPAVIGATLVELGDLDLLISSTEAAPVLAGILVAAVVGYSSLTFMRKTILKRRLHWFAVYCWAASILILVLQMT